MFSVGKGQDVEQFVMKALDHGHKVGDNCLARAGGMNSGFVGG